MNSGNLSAADHEQLLIKLYYSVVLFWNSIFVGLEYARWKRFSVRVSHAFLLNKSLLVSVKMHNFKLDWREHTEINTAFQVNKGLEFEVDSLRFTFQPCP